MIVNIDATLQHFKVVVQKYVHIYIPEPHLFIKCICSIDAFVNDFFLQSEPRGMRLTDACISIWRKGT